jgi:hypothetical protein
MADPLDRYRDAAGDRSAEVIAWDAVTLGPHVTNLADEEIPARLAEARSDMSKRLRELRDFQREGWRGMFSTPYAAHAIAVIAARERARMAQTKTGVATSDAGSSAGQPNAVVLGEDADSTLAPYGRVLGEELVSAIEERAASLVPFYEDRDDLFDSELVQKIGHPLAEFRPHLETIRRAATEVALQRELDHRARTRQGLGFDPWDAPPRARAANTRIGNVAAFRSAGVLIGHPRVGPLDAHRQAIAARLSHLDPPALDYMSEMLSDQIEPINSANALETQRHERNLRNAVKEGVHERHAAGIVARRESSPTDDRLHELPTPPVLFVHDEETAHHLAAVKAYQWAKSSREAVDRLRAKDAHLEQWIARNADPVARLAAAATNLEIARGVNASREVNLAITGRRPEKTIEHPDQPHTEITREPPQPEQGIFPGLSWEL